MENQITIQSDVLPDDAHVVAVRGTEAISLPYQFQIGLLIDEPDFDMEAAIRGRATLQFNVGMDDAPYAYHGILASIEHLHEWQGKALYRAVLVPQLWNLSQSLHSRVYTDNTIVEIIQAVLEHNGLVADDFAFQLQRDYPTVEHICQYKETDLVFISRWMEREGIYYFFEQGDNREKLIITDHKASHDDLIEHPVRYVPLSGGDAMATEALDFFTCKRSALPATVALADYDYINPTLEVAGSAAVASDGVGEIRVFGKNFLTPDQGTRLAEVRAEEMLARQELFHGRGRVFHLRPGYTFTLEEHPRSPFNRRYLVTELEHVGNQSAKDAQTKKLLELDDEGEFGVDEYGVQLVAIAHDTQYRAPERHPWPRIDGYEFASVCGEADSEYAQLDDHGRYRVRVKFDESDLVDGSASTWVRMLQPHGGGNEGFHFPLRKQTEVLLFFLGGDPDRPVIAGVAPNAHTPSPVTSANHTLNVVQTGGLNRMEMQDESGIQHVKVTCPTENTHIHLGAPNDDHNMHMCTDGDTIHYSGRNWDCYTHGEKYEFVGLDSELEIGGSQFITVTGIRCENVQQHVTENYDMDHVTTVLGMQDIEVNQTRTDHVVGDVTENYDAKQKTTVGTDQELTVGGNRTVEVTGNHDIDVVGNYTWNITQNYTQNVTQNVDITVNANYTTTTSGNNKNFKWADFFGLTGGISNQIYIGMFNRLFVINRNDVCIGMKSDSVLGMKMGMNVGINIDIDTALKLKLKITSIENLQTKIQTRAGPYLIAGAIWLATHGIEVHA